MKPTPQLIATDIVLFGKKANQVSVLLIQRKNEPYKNSWALPGGFVDPNEDVLDAAYREMQEETSVHLKSLVLTGVYGNPVRDPRGRVISCAFATVIPIDSVRPKAADDAKSTSWHAIDSLPELAFDHSLIISEAASKILK